MESFMETLRGLQSVRVSKDFLLDKLKTNRDNHRKLFEEALEGWHEAVLEALNEQIERVKADKKYNPSWHLPMPSDHTKEYDRIIEMMEASLDKEFELSSIEFNCYVRDEWGWKTDFTQDHVHYTNILNSKK